MNNNVKAIIDKYLPFSDNQRIDSFFYALKERNILCSQEIRTAVLVCIRKLSLQQYFLQNAHRHNAELVSSNSKKDTESKKLISNNQVKATSKKKAQKEKEEKFKELSNEQAIDSYINNNKQWWKINLLQNFVERIPKLVKSAELRQYFSLAIGKIRNKLKEEQLLKDVNSLTVKRKLEEFRQKGSHDIQPGDIYGAPQFFRYGEAGRSKKKHGCRVINKKTY